MYVGFENGVVVVLGAESDAVHVVSRAGCLVGATAVVSVGCASLWQHCVGFGAPLGPL